jgi:hypothetical protein
MRETTRTQGPPGLVTRRSLVWAGAAAFLACAVCCALPLSLVAGGSTFATFAVWLTPSMETYAAVTAALGILAFFAVRARRPRGCEPACAVDRSCCAPGREERGRS